jgi:hypothetical protein
LWALSIWLSQKNPIYIPFRDHACCMRCPYRHLLLDHSNYKEAVKSHRLVRRRGFHILSRQSAHRWR